MSVNPLPLMINHAGFEYIIVGKFPEITWAYRDIGSEEIEILTIYCSEPVVNVIHLAVMKMIIADLEAHI